MRIKGNSPRQRSRRSWRIPNAVEQAGAVGKRPAVPGHDRPPLGPVSGLIQNRGFKMRNLGPKKRVSCASSQHRKHQIGLTNNLSFL